MVLKLKYSEVTVDHLSVLTNYTLEFAVNLY